MNLDKQVNKINRFCLPGREQSRPGLFVPAAAEGLHCPEGNVRPRRPLPRMGKGGGKGRKTISRHKKTAHHGHPEGWSAMRPVGGGCGRQPRQG